MGFLRFMVVGASGPSRLFFQLYSVGRLTPNFSATRTNRNRQVGKCLMNPCRQGTTAGKAQGLNGPGNGIAMTNIVLQSNLLLSIREFRRPRGVVSGQIPVVSDHISPGWSEAARNIKVLSSLAVALALACAGGYWTVVFWLA